MALFYECMQWCAHIVLDMADIVRDGDSIEQAARESKLVRMSKSLPIEQLLKVAELATPEERTNFAPSSNGEVRVSHGPFAGRDTGIAGANTEKP
jgi:hypothetical protein